MTEQTAPEPQRQPDAAAHANTCGDGLVGNCDDALRDLYVYLDGEITDERRALISRHIDDCSPCLEAFDFEHELRDLVARTCRSDAPDSLKDRVAEAIRTCEDAPEGADPAGPQVG